MPSFHYRSKTTGLFYNGTDYIGYRNIVLAYSPKRKGKKPTKAELGKVFKDIGKAKTHLLFLTGYYKPPQGYEDLQKELEECRDRLTKEKNVRYYSDIHNEPEYQAIHRKIDVYEAIHPGYFNLPEWLYNPYPMELPTDWELVSVNTETMEQTVLDFDPVAYVAEQKRLQVLIDRFGQSVKDVYKKVEKKGVDEYPEFLVIGPDYNKMDAEKLWHLIEAPQPDTEKIDETFRNLIESEVTKKDYIRGTAGSTTTIAFKDVSTLILFRLAYTGKYTAHHIDVRTMTELVTGE